VLKPELAPPRLTPPAIKQQLLADAGVDDYVILPPAPEVLNLTAEAFWAILHDEVKPRHMIEGNSFNFGKGRGGNIERLREWSNGSGIELDVVDAVTVALLDPERRPREQFADPLAAGQWARARRRDLPRPRVRDARRGRSKVFSAANSSACRRRT
jgi:riboflavin kinase/FMN adenylyltransferase